MLSPEGIKVVPNIPEQKNTTTEINMKNYEEKCRTSSDKIKCAEIIDNGQEAVQSYMKRFQKNEFSYKEFIERQLTYTQSLIGEDKEWFDDFGDDIKKYMDLEGMEVQKGETISFKDNTGNIISGKAVDIIVNKNNELKIQIFIKKTIGKKIGYKGDTEIWTPSTANYMLVPPHRIR